MKMRKSTWLLLVLALAAILLVAGCAPTTPGNGDEEPGNGEPTPPPADKECPEVVSTVVSKISEANANLKIVITFNENIESSCIEDSSNWDIVVKNPGRKDTEITEADGIVIRSIAVSGKVVTVKAWVEEAYDISWYDFVPLPAGFTGYTTLAEAIAAADLIVEAIESYGALANDQLTLLGVFPADWSALLDTLEAAHDVQDGSLVADVNALATAATTLAADATALAADATALADPIGSAMAEAVINRANALVDRANALVDRANALALRAAAADPIGSAALALAAATLATDATALATATTTFAAVPTVGNAAALAAAASATTLNGSATTLAGNATTLAGNLPGSALTVLNLELIAFGYTAEEVTGTVRFSGLICNKPDADKYADTFDMFSVDAPTVADKVTWKLASGCVVSDELGNFCCGFSGENCCAEPYCEPCEECVLEEVACK